MGHNRQSCSDGGRRPPQDRHHTCWSPKEDQNCHRLHEVQHQIQPSQFPEHDAGGVASAVQHAAPLALVTLLTSAAVRDYDIETRWREASPPLLSEICFVFRDVHSEVRSDSAAPHPEQEREILFVCARD